ncbi:MAG: hypothetical protein RBT47_07345, partial [Anaerolineae bacterium]|jgi:hypothetical protein|nr:hypothetical protein [Anaerolineae bacterium]
MEPLYIGAVRVSQGLRVESDAAPLARLGDGDLTLHAVETTQRDPTDLQVKLLWSTPGTPRNWSLSLRLLDATGQQVASRDLQPGYGYLPTTLWAPDEKVTDYVSLSLPKGLAPGAYTLKVIAYLEATMGQQGETSLPITLTQVTLRAPSTFCEIECKAVPRSCKAAGVQLIDAALPETLREGEGLDFSAGWWAVTQPTADLTARWEVLGPDNTVIASTDSPLAPGSQTTLWPQHAWVRASVHLDLPPVLPAGPYTLQATLQDSTKTRASCQIGEPIPVTLRERSFSVPAAVHPQQASFAEILSLRGYEWEADQETLALTLWWQAGEQSPPQDYKRFIHLVETATAIVAAQDDAMPRAWTYPTSWWTPGEVVSETVTLDLRNLPAGTYRPAVGWYDGETGTRLTAVDGSGTPAPDDRIFLQDLVLERK